jgi:DedD protein
MGLLSIFKRSAEPSGGTRTSEASDAVRAARTRARRRLIGAVVLLVIGVIGFPLVFETRPRPIPVDIPIEIPKKDGAPALVMPPARPSAMAPSREEIITESRSDAGREIAPRSPVGGSAAATGAGASKPGARPATGAAPDAARRTASSPAAAVADAARAKALLEAKAPAAADAKSVPAEAKPAVADTTPAPADTKAAAEAKPGSADSSRFVVQVGAFAEAEAARETRAKAEKLGLKTYTQVAQTPAGSRIRVRVGPFGTRAEADAALAKARAAGLAAVVLTL